MANTNKAALDISEYQTDTDNITTDEKLDVLIEIIENCVFYMSTTGYDINSDDFWEYERQLETAEKTLKDFVKTLE